MDRFFWRHITILSSSLYRSSMFDKLLYKFKLSSIFTNFHFKFTSQIKLSKKKKKNWQRQTSGKPLFALKSFRQIFRNHSGLLLSIRWKKNAPHTTLKNDGDHYYYCRWKDEVGLPTLCGREWKQIILRLTRRTHQFSFHRFSSIWHKWKYVYV